MLSRYTVSFYRVWQYVFEERRWMYHFWTEQKKSSEIWPFRYCERFLCITFFLNCSFDAEPIYMASHKPWLHRSCVTGARGAFVRPQGDSDWRMLKNRNTNVFFLKMNGGHSIPPSAKNHHDNRFFPPYVDRPYFLMWRTRLWRQNCMNSAH